MLNKIAYILTVIGNFSFLCICSFAFPVPRGKIKRGKVCQSSHSPSDEGENSRSRSRSCNRANRSRSRSSNTDGNTSRRSEDATEPLQQSDGRIRGKIHGGTEKGSVTRKTHKSGTEEGSPTRKTHQSCTEEGSPTRKTHQTGTQKGSPTWKTHQSGTEEGSVTRKTHQSGTEEGRPTRKTHQSGTEEGSPTRKTHQSGTEEGSVTRKIHQSETEEGSTTQETFTVSLEKNPDNTIESEGPSRRVKKGTNQTPSVFKAPRLPKSKASVEQKAVMNTADQSKPTSSQLARFFETATDSQFFGQRSYSDDHQEDAKVSGMEEKGVSLTEETEDVIEEKPKKKPTVKKSKQSSMQEAVVVLDGVCPAQTRRKVKRWLVETKTPSPLVSGEESQTGSGITGLDMTSPSAYRARSTPESMVTVRHAPTMGKHSQAQVEQAEQQEEEDEKDRRQSVSEIRKEKTEQRRKSNENLSEKEMVGECENKQEENDIGVEMGETMYDLDEIPNTQKRQVLEKIRLFSDGDDQTPPKKKSKNFNAKLSEDVETKRPMIGSPSAEDPYAFKSSQRTPQQKSKKKGRRIKRKNVTVFEEILEEELSKHRSDDKPVKSYGKKKSDKKVKMKMKEEEKEVMSQEEEALVNMISAAEDFDLVFSQQVRDMQAEARKNNKIRRERLNREKQLKAKQDKEERKNQVKNGKVDAEIVVKSKVENTDEAKDKEDEKIYNEHDAVEDADVVLIDDEALEMGAEILPPNVEDFVSRDQELNELKNKVFLKDFSRRSLPHKHKTLITKKVTHPKDDWSVTKEMKKDLAPPKTRILKMMEAIEDGKKREGMAKKKVRKLRCKKKVKYGDCDDGDVQIVEVSPAPLAQTDQTVGRDIRTAPVAQTDQTVRQDRSPAVEVQTLEEGNTGTST